MRQNPMLQKLSPRTPAPTNNMLSLLQNSNNPQQLINNILTQNPQLTNLINQFGNGDPKTAFYEYARQSGQDPQQVLNFLQKFM
jgi:hypothetical protein